MIGVSPSFSAVREQPTELLGEAPRERTDRSLEHVFRLRVEALQRQQGGSGAGSAPAG
jgi:hypothetical protein